MTDVEVSVRDARVRASFRRTAAEIEAAIAGLHAWPAAKQPEPDEPPPASGDVEELQAAFDRTNLENLRPREKVLRHDEDLCEDVEGDEDCYGKAFPRETACCTSVLNFTRWLCGLQPVRIAEEKSRVTDILSQALLPRAPVLVTPQLQKDSVRFAATFQDFLEHQSNGFSILHGEGSLVAAVEQCLMATHCLKLPCTGASPDRESVAKALAARAAADTRGRDSLQPRQRGAPPPPPPPEHVTAAELPSALDPLRVFWDLQPAVCATLEDQAHHALHPHHRPRHAHGHSRRDSQHSHQPHLYHPLHVGHHHGPPEVIDPNGAMFGLSAVWGDRHGALAFRRCLLNPALQDFGASRRHDTCVFWTGAAAVGSEDRPAKGLDAPDAVCYPPTGLVPMGLLQYGKVPWTIAPDSRRFQPTAQTQVRMWRVRIERPADKDWTVERLSDVPVKAFTVDCATTGEPFCVIFWPDLPQYMHGDQFEVELSGLRGPTPDLAFFYELRSFLQRMLDNSLYTEASRIRSAFGDKLLWGSPIRRTFGPMLGSGGAAKRLSVASTKPAKPSDRRSSRRASLAAAQVEAAPPAIETISHHKTTIISHSPDLTILLRCKEAAAMSATLFLTHFGGEEEEVLFAVQVQKLAGQHFLLFIKLPMGRRHYELRFHVSHIEAPEEQLPHPMNYTISSTEQCPSLLVSLEDSNAAKFGYAPTSLVAQTHGVLLLAPRKRRVVIGQCYFLVYVDKATALESARAHVVAQGVGARAAAEVQLGTPGGRRGARKSVVEAQVVQPSPTNRDKDAAAKVPSDDEAALFTERLLGEGNSGSGPVVDLHRALRGSLRSHTQDGDGEVHFDVSVHNGECVQRLHERVDLPGLYEGLITLSHVDATHVVRLTMRFPRAHAMEYAPRVIGEWLTCRSTENLPSNF